MKRTWFTLLALVVLVSVAALAGPTACGHGRRGPHAFFEGGEVDTDRLRHGAEWVLRSADPTDEQIDRVVEIAAAALVDFRDMRGEREAHHERIVAALSGEAVDRADLDALRAESLARFDEGSKRALDAFVEAAEVFSPEQRAELIEEARKHRGRHHGRWH